MSQQVSTACIRERHGHVYRCVCACLSWAVANLCIEVEILQPIAHVLHRHCERQSKAAGSGKTSRNQPRGQEGLKVAGLCVLFICVYCIRRGHTKCVLANTHTKTADLWQGMRWYLVAREHKAGGKCLPGRMQGQLSLPDSPCSSETCLPFCGSLFRQCSAVPSRKQCSSTACGPVQASQLQVPAKF